MAGKLATEEFVKAIIKKHGIKATPLQVGKEWCLKFESKTDFEKFCGTFGVSGYESRDGFIACNLREQPYKPQIRF